MAGSAGLNHPAPPPVEKVGQSLTSAWWGYPTNSLVAYEITQIFGTLESLVVKGVPIDQAHTGIDIAMPVGTALYNPVHAVVNDVGTDDNGAHFIRLTMDNGDQVLLYHLNDMAVHVGQDLAPGTLLGHSGNTGLSTGPHLHFEVDQGGKPVDPFNWLLVANAPAAGPSNPLDALKNVNDFFGHLSNPGHDPCSPPSSEVGMLRVIDAVACPANWWKVGFVWAGTVMIIVGVFIYFIKEEAPVIKQGAETLAETAVVAA